MMVKRKLTSRRGMTLVEMMMAVLIMSLVSISIAAGTSAAARVYKDSLAVSESQLLASTVTEVMMDELRYARDVVETLPEEEARFTSRSYGSGVGFSIKKPDGGTDGVGHLQLGGTPVLGAGSYSSDVLGISKNGTSPLVRWKDGKFNVSLCIMRGTEVLQKITFYVTPLNG